MWKNLFDGFRAAETARVAVFMSGSGTNAAALLEYRRRHPECGFEPVAIVTDAPESSRAYELGGTFGVPVAALDIRRFYRERGEASITLDTARRREIREEWSVALGEMVAPFRPGFGVLAGFVPLTNLTASLPCLNVHPGDLTLEAGGRRLLAGLHIRPVERAILEGHRALRSSVILAQAYTGNGRGEMDSGPVLGISRPVAVDLEGLSLAELRAIDAARGGAPYRDRLRTLALANLERLKFDGDHRVLPPVVADFARGRFARSETGALGYRPEGEETFRTVKTVEYGGAHPVPVEPDAETMA